MKKILPFIIVILVLFWTPTFVMAQTSSSSSGSALPNRRLTITEDRVAKLKTKADREIDRRVTSLQAILTKINGIKRLSTASKTDLTNQIQGQITTLTTLKTKIDADTDIATLKADVQSIVLSYRIYLLFIPKVHILSAADVILDTNDKLTSISAQLQTKISDAKTSGKDVSSLETTLSDMQAKIADAKKQATDAQNAVLPLTPDGYPENKAILLSARTMLQTAKHDLQQARNDAKTIINGLKTNSSEKTATSSSR